MKSVVEINILKDRYIKSYQEEHGCIVLTNKWEFVKSPDGRLIDCLLKLNGLNSDGEPFQTYTGINSIINNQSKTI